MEQAYFHPASEAAWQPSREELEQYEIDKERIKEVLESYKTVERILDKKEERRDESLVSLFFCKWNSKCGDLDKIVLMTISRLAICGLHLGE